MSVQTLYSAATGMESMQTKLDVIANNLANVNTVGFKKGRANFEDLFYRHETLPGATDSAGNTTAVGTSIGLGSRVSSVQSDFKQGAFQQSSRNLDVAIEGNGFFQVQDPGGSTLYSRAGNLSVDAQNRLVLGSASTGRLIEPAVTLPNNTTGVTINPDGTVLAQVAGQNNMQQVTTLQLANFQNPEGLLKLGENLYAVTDASGAATTGNPGADGRGVLRQNALEASNVEPVQELIDLITTQRSFELNSQTVKAGDEMLQTISNMRR